MTITTDSGITEMLQTTKTIALVGASPNPDRPSHAVMRYLMDRGYKIIPVNPTEPEILGLKTVASVKDITESVDMVDVFRNSEAAGPVIDDAIAVGAKYVWTQLGVFNDPAVARAEAAGLQVVVDKCPAIEMPRLGIGPENPHKPERRRAREAAAAAAGMDEAATA